jgi:hypothetical protein
MGRNLRRSDNSGAFWELNWSAMAKAFQLRSLRVVAVLLLAAIFLRAEDQKVVSKLPVDGNTAMRFLFRRPNANYVLPPLIFRVADVGSSNWNSAPIDRNGRSAFISLSEMRSLVRELNGNRNALQISSAVESIKPFEEMPISENVIVTIYFSNGTATANIHPREICNRLAQLNNLIEGRRAHWEFEYFRLGCGCKVPSHKYEAYPNDR